MIIRKAKQEDLEQLIILCKEHIAYEKAFLDNESKLNSLTEFLFEPDTFLQCLVVEDSGVLVGYATFMKQFSTWDASFYVYLDCLYLKEATRGKGIGKQMMDKIKEYALLENCRVIQWQTPTFNVNAIGFYESLGAISSSKERFTWVLD